MTLKQWNTLAWLDQYPAANSKYTRGECPHPHKWRWIALDNSTWLQYHLNNAAITLGTQSEGGKALQVVVESTESTACSKWAKFWLKLNFTLKFKVNQPKNSMDVNQGDLHFWSKFRAPSLNRWWVIIQTNSWFIHSKIQTDRYHFLCYR